MALASVVGAARGHGRPGAPQPDPKPARDGGRRLSLQGPSAGALAAPEQRDRNLQVPSAHTLAAPDLRDLHSPSAHPRDTGPTRIVQRIL